MLLGLGVLSGWGGTCLGPLVAHPAAALEIDDEEVDDEATADAEDESADEANEVAQPENANRPQRDAGTVGVQQRKLPESLLPVPREMRRVLEGVREAIAKGEYADAVIPLDELLNRDGGEDYFLDGPVDAETRNSLLGEVQRLIANLPAEGRQAYELQCGARARRLLEEGLSTRAPHLLAECSRRYFHTEAGYEATLLLGYSQLAQGNTLAAARAFERLAAAPAAVDRYEPELSLSLAAAWWYGQRAERSVATLMNRQRNFPNAPVQIAGKPLPIFEREDQALSWLEQVLHPHDAYAAPLARDWLMFRADPERSARAAGGKPVTVARWRAATAPQWDEQKTLQSLLRQQQRSLGTSLIGLQPIVVDGVVLTRSPRQLLATDLASGKRIWQYPWYAQPEHPQLPSAEFAEEISAPGREHEEQMLYQRVWEDAAFGQVSSNGESVFLLEDLGPTPSLAQQQHMQQQIIWGLNGQSLAVQSNRRLIALDLKTEGKMRWALGRDTMGDPGDDPRLEEAYFLGPPLPMGDTLYVMAELHGEVRLLALESRTGNLLWAQQLQHFDAARSVSIDAGRRLIGATPSHGDGILVCPTSGGAVIGLDVNTRTLLWVYAYYDLAAEHGESDAPFRLNAARIAIAQRSVADRWRDASAIIERGHVVLTPPETDQLFCLDLLTGEPAWPPQPREDSQFVGCIHEDMILLVGHQQLRALRLDNGQPAWPAPIPLPSGTAPSGRGFAHRGEYFLPLTNAQLLRIDLERGTILESLTTDAPLGNLVCAQHQVISQSADWVQAFHLRDDLQTRVQRLLADNPLDLTGTNGQSLLLVADGRYREAALLLHATLQGLQGMQPTPSAEISAQSPPQLEALRVRLVATQLQALRQDFAANQDLIPLLHAANLSLEQRADFLQLLAQGHERAGQHLDAFAAYWQLAQFYHELNQQGTIASAGGGAKANVLLRIDANVSVHRDRWLAARMEQLYQAADSSVRQQLRATIDDAMRAAMAAPDATSLEQFLIWFDWLGPDRFEAQLELALRRLASQQPLAAEFLLLDLMDEDDPHTAAAATAHMARLFEESEQYELAARMYERLAERWPTTICLAGQTGAQLAASLSPLSPVTASGSRSPQWPNGVIQVQKVQNEQPLNWTQDVTIPLGQFKTITDTSCRVAADQRDALCVYDALGNLQRVIGFQGKGTRNAPRFIHRAFQMLRTAPRGMRRGNLLALNTGSQVFVLDLLAPTGFDNGGLLWQDEVLGTSSNHIFRRTQPQLERIATEWGGDETRVFDPQHGMLGLTSAIQSTGVCYQSGQELRCADPLTGIVWWSRTDMPAGAELLGNRQRLFVVPADGSPAIVLSMVDGQRLGERAIPPRQRRWTHWDDQVLTWDELDPQDKSQPRSRRLGLFDPWLQKFSWSFDFLEGSRACLVEGQELAVLEPDGRFRIFSRNKQRPLVDAQLNEEAPPRSPVKQIRVLRFADQYVLVVNRAPEQPRSTPMSPFRSQSPHLVLQDATLHAFARDSGDSVWTAPVHIEDYVLPLEQPFSLPVLTLVRSTGPANRRPRPNSQQPEVPPSASLACLDRRDGRIVLIENQLPMAHMLSVTGHPDRQMVAIQIQENEAYQLTFTDQPRPPAAPADLRGTAGFNRHLAPSPLAETAGNLLDWLVPSQPAAPAGRPAQPDGAPDPVDQDPFGEKE